MKLLLSIFVAFVLCDNETVLFEYFVKQFNRDYIGSERANRFAVFKDNMMKIRAMNAEDYPHTEYGINQFSDMTQAEFLEHVSCIIQPGENEEPKCDEAEPKYGIQLDDIDWRKKGAVSPVQDQLWCGSCWAFSASGSMESSHFLATGELVNLSEEQLVDCDMKDDGCCGGWMNWAFKYAIENGMQSEEDYPYNPPRSGCHGTCVYDKSKVKANFKKCIDLDGESGIETQIMTQPIAIAVDAGVLQSYSGGVISGKKCSGTQMNHGNLVVGYQKSHDAWIIKNCWSEKWGEKGYFRVKHGVNCLGMGNVPSYMQIPN